MAPEDQFGTKYVTLNLTYGILAKTLLVPFACAFDPRFRSYILSDGKVIRSFVNLNWNERCNDVQEDESISDGNSI